jgi:putative addiction module killer protein
MLDVRYYVSASGDEPFAEWFAELDASASAKIVRALARIEQGNLSNLKGVGEGVLEFRIDFGPGGQWQKQKASRNWCRAG